MAANIIDLKIGRRAVSIFFTATPENFYRYFFYFKRHQFQS